MKLILLWAFATVALAQEPIKVGEGMCSDTWVTRPCEKYLYKGNVYVAIFEDGEIYRLVKLTEDGEELIYQAPKRYWI